MTRIYRYILQTDTGMAPCIDGGRLGRKLINWVEVWRLA